MNTRSRRGRHTRRFAISLLIAGAVVVVGGSAALADQTYLGNLGKPDSMYVGEQIQPGPVGWPLSIPPAQCADIPGVLIFPYGEVQWAGTLKWWDHAQLTSSGWWPYVERSSRFTGSVDAFGATWSVHGNVFQSQGGESWGGLYLASGKVFVMSTDGRQIFGDALVGESPFPTRGIWVLWQGTPTCK